MSTCWRLKQALLSRFFAAQPAVPTLRLSSDSTSITAAFQYTPPTPYNAGDCFELQLFPTEQKLIEALGSALDWCTFYEGAARQHVIDRLPAERGFRVRARAKNARGVSAWTEEAEVSTKAVATRCGGKGPGYTWDQTPEAVELFVAVPAGTGPRDVVVDVKPRRIRVSARGATLLEGPLGGEVLAANGAGDWEWELADADGDAEAGKHVAITLNKKGVSYDPKDQWCCAVDAPGHPQVDVLRMTWTRKRPWRPPQDARTLEEASAALPGNAVLAKPLNEVPASGEELADWGGQWRKPGSK